MTNPTTKPGSPPKLNAAQREQLLEWLAADYAWALIVQWFAERAWPDITRQTASYYRTRYCRDVEARAKARRESALATGLALKEERVARLKAHADKLEAIKWEPDERGRLWNEKAWRETLDDIAKETGGRVQKTELSGEVITKSYTGVDTEAV